jgi:hypothetical protein
MISFPQRVGREVIGRAHECRPVGHHHPPPSRNGESLVLTECIAFCRVYRQRLLTRITQRLLSAHLSFRTALFAWAIAEPTAIFGGGGDYGRVSGLVCG